MKALAAQLCEGKEGSSLLDGGGEVISGGRLGDR